MSKDIKYKDKISDYDYSLFHRNIAGAYSIDIDSVEFRKGKGIVALICRTANLNDNNHIYNSKRYIWERTEFERNIVSEISQKMNIPAYYVIHTKDLSIFHVHKLPNKEVFKVMSREEYSVWISLL